MDKLDDGVTRIVLQGLDTGPHDLVALRRYLMLILELLAEKANESEPSWPAALGSAGEIEALLEVEARIAEKAAERPAGCLGQVLDKLAIWELLAAGDEDAGIASMGNLVVRSVIADLRGLRAAA